MKMLSFFSAYTLTRLRSSQKLKEQKNNPKRKDILKSQLYKDQG